MCIEVKVKNITERTTQIMSIFHQLQSMNLGIMRYEEFDKFKTICNDFIRNGHSVHGNIPVFGTKRIIQYNFNDHVVECNLKYQEDV